MKRLGYTKSRNGCSRCKQRRVKCDEHAPCQACSRHGVRCSLQSTGSKPRPDSTSSQLPEKVRKPLVIRKKRQTASRPVPSLISTRAGSFLEQTLKQESAATAPPPFTYFSKFLCEMNTGARTGLILDLELMHHYTGVAHCTIYSSCPHVYKVLQQDVTKEAFSFPFLLQQLLAFSGFHMAFLHPDRRHQYLFQASQHQSLAIAGMSSILTADLIPSNCHALYASSVFVIISAFGAYPSCDRYNSSFQPIDSLVDIFILIRGMSMILDSSGPHLRNGPLKGLFGSCLGPQVDLTKHLQPIADQLHQVKLHLAEQNSSLDDNERDALLDAVTSLTDLIAEVTSSHKMAATPELRAVFAWPMRISTTYLDLMRRCHPLALVVLSYYCALLHSREGNYWFFEGWANALINLIKEQLVDSPWAERIQWAVETIQKSEV
ncbi:hypothetical protein BGZ61DRAFT_507273 [Ilyonectria robusta]|uniref:uncharacterized protein n=1 Tax=Ilyonectria robusta TaxID=1079257 RepID=UPI001E8E56B9|nr:uncharacterized protein BGZ61DRAFT_507273 [Ilyonectria robusta]KAH8684976.1 hypothetical protein BGZ61DRAFT_507273 [Ilyonectria robusta]